MDGDDLMGKGSLEGRRVKWRWKVVVAADTPWRGAVYETRAGRHREEFDGPEELLRAVEQLTGWRLPDG